MDKQVLKRLKHQLTPATLSYLDGAVGGEAAFKTWCLERAISAAPPIKLFDTVVDKLGPIYIRLGDNHRVELIYDEHPVAPMAALRKCIKPGSLNKQGQLDIPLQSFHHRSQKYYCLKLTQTALGDLLGCYINDVMVFDLEDMFRVVFGVQLKSILLALAMYDKRPVSRLKKSLKTEGGLTGDLIRIPALLS